MTAEQPHLASGIALVLALLTVIVIGRIIGRMDPPFYTFVPVLHGDEP